MYEKVCAIRNLFILFIRLMKVLNHTPTLVFNEPPKAVFKFRMLKYSQTRVSIIYFDPVFIKKCTNDRRGNNSKKRE